VNRTARAEQPVELFENLAGDIDGVGRADQPDFVAAGVCLDPELLLEDVQGVVAFAVELGCRVVVVEYQGLTRAGLVLDQGASEDATCSFPCRLPNGIS
jgi:hypothetical protein